VICEHSKSPVTTNASSLGAPSIGATQQQVLLVEAAERRAQDDQMRIQDITHVRTQCVPRDLLLNAANNNQRT
jgi:hypothetical protein